MSLAVRAHLLTRKFPRGEQLRIADHLAKSATSVASNITEGYGRRRSVEYIRFRDIANGSLCKTETQLEICARLALVDEKTAAEFLEASQSIGRMLTGLHRSIANWL